MKHIIFTCVILLMASLSAKAVNGTLSAQRGVVNGAYNFWFYNPDPQDEEDPKPVVIFLHGQSLCGNNLDRVKRYGTIDAITKGQQIDAYVIAPQNPGGAWNPDKIARLLDWAWDNYNIDEDRVYVIGMSLGGYGVIDLANAYPDRIAAAMAFCGGGTGNDFSGLSQVPLWIVHGTADTAVPVSASDRVANALRNSGNDSRLVYQRVPGMNHSRPARYFYLPESYEWLFSHSLQDEGRPVNTEVFSPDVTNRAYGSSNRTSRSRRHTSARRNRSRRR